VVSTLSLSLSLYRDDVTLAASSASAFYCILILLSLKILFFFIIRFIIATGHMTDDDDENKLPKNLNVDLDVLFAVVAVLYSSQSKSSIGRFEFVFYY
jgi:nitrogen fixation/metabolism regulation signal transduction histidine kinase